MLEMVARCAIHGVSDTNFIYFKRSFLRRDSWPKLADDSFRKSYKMRRIVPYFGTMKCRPQTGLGELQPRQTDEFHSLCERGQLDKAVNVMLGMDKQSTLSSLDMFQSLLKACSKKKALPLTKRVYAHLVKHNLESTRCFGEPMVSALVKCGGLADALQVFHQLSHRTVFSWTAMISGHAMAGHCRMAFKMYEQMQAEGIKPNTYTFVSLLKACSSVADLEGGRRIHAEAIKHRCVSDLFVGNCLLDMYGKCRSIMDAEKVFNEMTNRDVVSWTAMVAAYGQHGQPKKALQLYERMRDEGVSPNDRTFVSALQACSMLADKQQYVFSGECTAVKYLEWGKALHADSWKRGYDSDVFVGNTLISMYGKFGSDVDARVVFNGLSERDVVSWNVMLQTYVQQGEAEKALQLFEAMREDASTNQWSFVTTLQACSILAEKENRVAIDGQSTALMSLRIGRLIHVDAWSKGLDSHTFVANTLLSAYGKCGSILDAQVVFDAMPQQDVVSWNVMLATYVEHGQEQKALELYQQMQEEGMSPDLQTLMSAIQACGILAEKGEDTCAKGKSFKAEPLAMGRSIHAHAWRKGYDSDVFVRNTMVSMYGKCGSIADARIAFDEVSERNVVSWNVMLVTYVEQGNVERALDLYRQMWLADVSRDARTMVTVLQACRMMAETEEDYSVRGAPTKVKSLAKGKAIHADAQRQGFCSDVFVGNTLLSMYGKCGSIEDAQIVFSGLSERNLVSWTAMLAAYVEQGLAEKALQLYRQMNKEGVRPGVRSLVSALQACGILAEKEDAIVYGQSNKAYSLEIGKEIHCDALRNGFDSDVYVGSALVHMYGRCGSMADAWNVFDELPKRNVVLWNAMLAVHAQQGLASKTFELYEKMMEEAVSPDAWSYVSALQACGMLAEKERQIMQDGCIVKVDSFEKGRAIHADTWRKDCFADVFVGRALVSMYGKCGSLTDVVNVFDGFIQPDVSMWNAMLAAYVEQAQAEKVLQLYEQMQEESFSPSSRSFVSILQAFRMLGEKEEVVAVNGRSTKPIFLQRVRAVHAHAVKRVCDLDVFLVSMMVGTYGKCGSMADAQSVFDGLTERSAVSWNAILSVYVEQGQAESALLLYEQMREECVSPDPCTILSAVQACGMLAEMEEDVLMDGTSTKVHSLNKVRALHATALRKHYDLDVFVGSALITMYGKCGRLVDACNVFDEMGYRDLVVWTAMLAAYVDQGCGEKALDLYRQMHLEGVSPGIRTFVSALHACSMVAENEVGIVVDGTVTKVKSLAMGRAIHADAQKRDYESDLFIGNTLIGMYGKCGSITDAHKVFARLGGRNVVSWNAMLSAYVQQGDVENALQVCREMQEEGQSADEITLVLVLQVCSNAGSLAILRQIHHTLISEGRVLSPFLASTLVTAYGRCARMVDAQNVFHGLSHPDLVSWNALIAGYARQGDCAASLRSYEEMLLTGVKPDSVTFLVILTACSHAGLVDKGVEIFKSMMTDHGMAPEMDHYVSMVNLFGRAGHFTTLEQFISTLPLQPNLALWLSVLSACRKHGKVVLGKAAFDCAVQLQPKHPAAYVLMSNILADCGFWELAKKLKKVRQEGGAQKEPGQSWIEHEQELHTFMVGDADHTQEFYGLLSSAS